MPLKKGWNAFKNHPLDYILGTPDQDEPEPLQKKDYEIFAKRTQSIELYRDYFIGISDGKRYTAKYDEPHIHCFLSHASVSIEELLILERPCDNSIIRRICDSPKKLRKVIVLDDIPKRDEEWIRHRAPPNANIIFPILYLSKLLKSSSYDTLVFDQIAFRCFFVPFKDLASFQLIKHLIICGSFRNDYLNSTTIAAFIKFINRFPNLVSIEACFKLKIQPSASRQPLYQDSYEGFSFYETMKKMKASLFQGLSQKVHGVIHFGASISSFQNMCSSMKYNLNQSSKALKPPIEYNEADSIIERKFRPHHGLQVKFSITPASYSQEMG